MTTRVHPSSFRCSNWNPFENFEKRKIAANSGVVAQTQQASQAWGVGSMPIARSRFYFIKLKTHFCVNQPARMGHPG